MKRTGRTLDLINDIDTINPVASISDLASGLRLTTIFNDDREGYGWKVTEFVGMGSNIAAVQASSIDMMLTSARPDSFASQADFATWATNEAITANSLVGIYNIGFSSKLFQDQSVIKTDHVAVNHLALLYEEGNIPFYKIRLEEFTISDKEEIVFKLKEVGQNVGQRS